ncbi:hypothetical protein T484DRAFT_1758141 [Baffinella frigidus]|nr:hypothetical protein T484DRAFT_1758141 [Cryptophyta sp. CCMP2293]
MHHSAGYIAENPCGCLVHAKTATRSDAHKCVSCRQIVTLKRGPVNIPHFAHSVTNTVNCSGYKGGETIQHLEAKSFLANNINDFCFILQSCSLCNDHDKTNCVKFNRDAWKVTVEGNIKGTTRRADVLLQLRVSDIECTGPERYSLEVKHSNAVSTQKTIELDAVGCGIIEISCNKVMQYKHMIATDKPWYIVNEHKICRIPWTCVKCIQQNAKHLQQNAERLQKRRVLQAQTYDLIECCERRNFKRTSNKCKGKCTECKAWMYHDNFHEFYYDDEMTRQERWWQHKIQNDDFLANQNFVRKMVFCFNCVACCLNCGYEQPLEQLEKYGLCRRCNMEDTWFDYGGINGSLELANMPRKPFLCSQKAVTWC